jgi:hypothetical protein
LPSTGNRALKFGSATPAVIAPVSWLDLWYNEMALKFLGDGDTA